MAKRSMAAAFALVLLAGSAAMAQPKEKEELVSDSRGLTETVMTMRVPGWLVFGPDGKVKKFGWKPVEGQKGSAEMSAIDTYIKNTIHNWRFRPYLQDGVAVDARTYFQMTLAARTKDPEKYEISVDNVSFTDGVTGVISKDEQKKSGKDATECVVNCMLSQPRWPLQYPRELERAGVSGAVIVHLYLNPDGTVADARVAQSALYNVRGDDGDLDKSRKFLEEEALRYARQVRMAPGSGSHLVGDNHLVGALPFIFQMKGDKLDNLGAWRIEQRSKRSVAPWLVHGPDRWIGVSDISGNGFVSMEESRYKLVSDATAP